MSQPPETDEEEWQELLPNDRRAPLRFVEDWLDIAMYRKPQNLGIFEAIIAAWGLAFLPVVLLGVLGILVVSHALLVGALTVGELVAQLQATTASVDPITLEAAARQTALTLIEFLLYFPLYLAYLVLFKLLFKLKRRVGR